MVGVHSSLVYRAKTCVRNFYEDDINIYKSNGGHRSPKARVVEAEAGMEE